MLAQEIQLHSLDHFSSLEGGVWAQDLETNEHFSFNARLIIVGTRELSVNYVEVCMYITCTYVRRCMSIFVMVQHQWHSNFNSTRQNLLKFSATQAL